MQSNILQSQYEPLHKDHKLAATCLRLLEIGGPDPGPGLLRDFRGDGEAGHLGVKHL